MGTSDPSLLVAVGFGCCCSTGDVVLIIEGGSEFGDDAYVGFRTCFAIAGDELAVC